MEPEFQDYFDVLSYNLETYKGEYASFIDNGPELFKFLNDLLITKELAPEYRLTVSAAIAYYVVPMDVVPEQIYGPYGYIDDIFITAHVIKLLAEEYGYAFLEKFWSGDSELKPMVDECYEKSIEILDDKIEEVLDFVGLK